MLGKLSNFEVYGVKKLENSTENARKHNFFEISPLALYGVEREAEKSGLEIVGFYHSHPNARAILSAEDKSFMVPGLAYIVASVEAGKLKEIKGYLRPAPDAPVQEIDVIKHD